MHVHASGAHTATMRAGAQRWTDGLTLTAIFTGATPLESVTCVCSTDLITMPPERGLPPVDESIIDMHGGGARSCAPFWRHAGDMKGEVSVETYVLSC